MRRRGYDEKTPRQKKNRRGYAEIDWVENLEILERGEGFTNIAGKTVIFYTG